MSLVNIVAVLTSCSSGPGSKLASLKVKYPAYRAELDKDRYRKDTFFARNPNSPFAAVSDSARPFRGLEYFAPDTQFRVAASVEWEKEPAVVKLQTTTGEERPMLRAAKLVFTLKSVPCFLWAYAEPNGHNFFFIPFKDATNGTSTYGGGRYLDLPIPRGDAMVIDFNLAYNPWCHYSHNYSCPLVPAENHLRTAVEAGEKTYR